MSDVFRKEYKSIDEITKNRIAQIKDDAQRLLNSMDWSVEADPRMIALAKTNLEQSVMWAIKAIT